TKMSLVEKEKNPIAEQSRQWLMQSLLDLMSQQDYARITVTEIAEHALLSRRTFYRIFDSKDQVLQQCFLERCEDYITYFQKDRHYTLEQLVEVFFTFWEKQINFLRLLQRNHLFYDLLEEFNRALPVIYDTVRGNQNLYDSIFEKKAALLVSAGALWNLLSEWMQMENRPSPKEISKMMLQIIASNS
ncbi:TetR/AcrR family transcriptional regulator, partial [Selenomonas sputigena]